MSPADRGLGERGWMEQAFALATLGEGRTSPNPRVGCVLVRSGQVVGRGYHRAAGLPHAEVRALAEAGEWARGATLFINLEPCSHHGRTPPCAELLVKSGVVRVVASVVDPNPLVDGRGFQLLEGAGIEVRVGPMAEEARKLNAAFFHWHTTGRPLVTLKAAISLDGMLSASAGRSQWITGDPARRFAHRLRLRHDAILVGAGTVRRDDPRLTVRLPRVRAPRVRAVLAPNLDLDPGARLFQRADPDEPLARVYVARSVPAEAAKPFQGRVVIVRVPVTEGRLDLEEVLSDLARLEVQSLLVEGGARTFSGFLDAGLADRAAVFVAPKLFGARGGTPMLDRLTVDHPDLGWRIEPDRRIPLGEDLLLEGAFCNPSARSQPV